MALVGGRWFDGAKFVVRTVYVVGHDLSATPPKTITKTFQLAGQFIVPPFGDAPLGMYSYELVIALDRLQN